MNNEKKFVKQSFVFDKETLPVGMPYAITNKEANGNEFFALLQNVSPDLLVFKVVDVTGDEYDYTVSINSYVDEKVVIKGPLHMTHYIDDPEGEWKLREVPECNKIEVTSEMLFGKEVTPEMLFDKNEDKNLQPWEEWDEKKRQEDEELKQLINGSVVYVVKYEGDSLSEAFYQAYRPDGTKDDNYPLPYPVDTGFWIVPSDDPEYKDYVFDVCGRKWPYKVIPRENGKEK